MSSPLYVVVYPFVNSMLFFEKYNTYITKKDAVVIPSKGIFESRHYVKIAFSLPM
jgi:hypothetical protein